MALFEWEFNLSQLQAHKVHATSHSTNVVTYVLCISINKIIVWNEGKLNMVEYFQEGSSEQHKMVLLLIFHRAWLKIYFLYKTEMIGCHLLWYINQNKRVCTCGNNLTFVWKVPNSDLSQDSIYTTEIRDFPESLQAVTSTEPYLSQGHYLPCSYQFIVH